MNFMMLILMEDRIQTVLGMQKQLSLKEERPENGQNPEPRRVIHHGQLEQLVLKGHLLMKEESGRRKSSWSWLCT